MSRSLDAFIARRRLRADQRTVVRPGGEKLLSAAPRAKAGQPDRTPPSATPPGPPIQPEE